MATDSPQASFLHLAARQVNVQVLLPVLVAAIALLCWRLWRFTILPILQPSAPPELPYWIPVIGHAHSFFKDYNKAIQQARVYFNGSNMPFSVTVGGARLYVCSAPEDVAGLYRNTTTISFDNVVQDMYRWIKMSEDGFAKIFTLDAEAKHNIDMGQPLKPVDMINEYHRRQTKPGPLFDDMLLSRFIPSIDKSLDEISLGSRPCLSQRASADGEGSVSLLRLCSELFLRTTTTIFLGRKLWEVNPKFLDSFELWERTNWKYMFQMPEIISRDMVQARDSMIDTFVDYLAIPAEERSDCNYFVRSVEAMLVDLELGERDKARVFMLHIWAVLGNIYKVAFWAMAHLAYDESLLNSIRDEVAVAYKDGVMDESHIANNYPLLDSLLCEVLRVTISTALVRDVVAPTHIRGLTLQPGSRVLVPYMQLHQDQSVWGANPQALTPGRFFQEPKLTSSKSYRPFGGGHTLCPGRFLAKRAIAYVIASAVTKFEVSLDVEMTRKLVGGSGTLPDFPRMDATKPSPGASLPFRGEDVILVIKKTGGSKK